MLKLMKTSEKKSIQQMTVNCWCCFPHALLKETVFISILHKHQYGGEFIIKNSTNIFWIFLTDAVQKTEIILLYCKRMKYQAFFMNA